MLSLNPEDRPTCEKVLVDYRNTIFPDYFYTFLQDYVNDMYYKSEGAGGQDPTMRFASKADDIVEAIADDWSGIIRAVIQEHQLSVGNNDVSELNGDVKAVDYSKYVESTFHSGLKLAFLSWTGDAAPKHPYCQHEELSSCLFPHQGARAASPHCGSHTRRGSH